MIRLRATPLLAGLGLALALTLVPDVARAGMVRLGGVRIVVTNPDPIYDVFLNLDVPAGQELDAGDTVHITNAPGIETINGTTLIPPPPTSPLFLHVAGGIVDGSTPGTFDVILSYSGPTITNPSSTDPLALSFNDLGYRSITNEVFTDAQLTTPIFYFTTNAAGQVTFSGTVTPTIAPEPAALVILATGLPALAWFRSLSRSRRLHRQTSA